MIHTPSTLRFMLSIRVFLFCCVCIHVCMGLCMYVCELDNSTASMSSAHNYAGERRRRKKHRYENGEHNISSKNETNLEKLLSMRKIEWIRYSVRKSGRAVAGIEYITPQRRQIHCTDDMDGKEHKASYSSFFFISSCILVMREKPTLHARTNERIKLLQFFAKSSFQR